MVVGGPRCWLKGSIRLVEVTCCASSCWLFVPEEAFVMSGTTPGWAKACGAGGGTTSEFVFSSFLLSRLYCFVDAVEPARTLANTVVLDLTYLEDLLLLLERDLLFTFTFFAAP